MFVQYDIQKGVAIADGGDSTDSCYECLLSGSCLDWPKHHVTGNECGDLTGTFGSGGEAAASLCVAVLQCIVNNGCDAPTGFGETNCYCGPEGEGTAGSTSCETATSVNGACEEQELAGFSYTTNTAIVTNFDDTTEPSGVANQIYACAQVNGCSTGMSGSPCP